MPFFARIFLPFLLLAYIATETYLKLEHSSLCGEVGCKLAGELLQFDPLYLNYFGLAGVLMLIILGLLSLKSKLYESLFFIGLYGAIAFEATIISYQFVANPEPCIFCLGIFSSLLLIALFSHVRHFAITLATILAIFIGLNTLSVTKNKAFMVEDGTYLIQSKSCSHCKKVKHYLAEHKVAYTSISVKEASARNFLKFANISSIPVLVTKDENGFVTLVGDKNIIGTFDDLKNEAVQEEIPMQSSSLGASSGTLNSDFLGAGGADDGCAITITQTPDCAADDNATQIPAY